MYSYQNAVRAALREHPDGLTTFEISQITKAPRHTVGKILPRMPDSYIDRYLQNNTRGKPYTAVWCVVVPPPNCPKPIRRKNVPS